MRGRGLWTLFLLLVCSVMLAGCGSNTAAQSSSLPATDKVITNPPSPEPTQGITGHVYFWQGDFMPTIGSAPSGKITPVSREVLIYRPTTFDDLRPYATTSGSIYSQIPTELVAKTASNDSGYFEVTVPPGTYSVIIRERDGYYGNIFDGQYRVNSVTVTTGTMTDLRIDITYQAVF